MIRWITLFALLCFTLLIFGGCGRSNESKDAYTPKGIYKENTNYIIGITAFSGNKQMFVTYRPILNYLEENIKGTKFELATSKDFVENEKRTRKNEFHFVLSNPYQSLVSFDYGYRPIAKVKNDAIFRGIILARKDAHIKSFQQLRGNIIAFAAPTALGGTIMPKYFLWEHGIDVRHDMSADYVGSHYSAILNTYTKDALVTATWPSAWEGWKKENPIKAEEMEVIWETKPLINIALSVRSDVDPELAKKVTALLIALNRTPRGQEILKNAGLEGFEIANNKTFDPVRVFLHRYESALGKIQ